MLGSLPKKAVTWWRTLGLNVSQEPSFAAPVLIDGLFKRRRRLTFNESGEEIGVDNTFAIDREVKIGDYLSGGDHTAVGDPRSVAGAVRVVNCKVTPNLRGNESRFLALG